MADKEIRHLSKDASRRMRSGPEKIFAEKWQKTNERRPGINGGFGTLEILMNDSRWTSGPLFMGDVQPWRPISQRDAVVAATVVQWFGTNCGRSFLWECERAVKELSEADRERSMKRWQAQAARKIRAK